MKLAIALILAFTTLSANASVVIRHIWQGHEASRFTIYSASIESVSTSNETDYYVVLKLDENRSSGLIFKLQADSFLDANQIRNELLSGEDVVDCKEEFDKVCRNYTFQFAD